MKKISTHFGINRFDPNYYGSGNDLKGCENDCKLMHNLFKSLGYQGRISLSRQSTSKNFKDTITYYSQKLSEGDTFVFTISSHGTYKEFYEGSQLKRITGICFRDRIMFDGEVKSLLSKFQKGVKVIWITDCCFAQDNFKMKLPKSRTKTRFFDSKAIQVEVTEFTTVKELNCTLVAYSSSTQYQPSYDSKSFQDNRPLGLFTACIESLFNNLIKGELSYYNLYKQLLQRISQTGYPQTPVFATVNDNSDLISKIFAQG